MEKTFRHCKNCGELKERINAGRYPNGKDTRYVDSLGKQWSGNWCESCHKERTRLKTLERRSNNKK